MSDCGQCVALLSCSCSTGSEGNHNETRSKDYVLSFPNLPTLMIHNVQGYHGPHFLLLFFKRISALREVVKIFTHTFSSLKKMTFHQRLVHRNRNIFNVDIKIVLYLSHQIRLDMTDLEVLAYLQRRQ